MKATNFFDINIFGSLNYRSASREISEKNQSKV